MKFLLSGLILFFLSGMSFAESKHPGFAVVELFTSEGCSSCPPADQIVRELKEHADRENLPIYILGFHVDYWNNLGWKDPFSKSEYSARQREYAKKLGSRSVYTPQIIVNGKTGFVGSRKSALDQAVAESLETFSEASIELELRREKEGVMLSYAISGATSDDLLNIAIVEDARESHVTAGENSGRDLKHVNVVQNFHSSSNVPAAGFFTLTQDCPANGKIIVFLSDRNDFSIKSVSSVSCVR